MLLLDENLSPKLAARLSEYFPDTIHVLHVKLDNSPDMEIWRYAKEKQLTIVSKDKDFVAFAQQHGHPPKLIRLRTGNVRIGQIEQVLLKNQTLIYEFINYSHESYLIID